MTNDKSGRPQVRLWKNGKSERFSISRLVANAFIPNPENKPEVKHLDGNANNNAVNNLKWSNHKELYEIADKMFKELGYKKRQKNYKSGTVYEYEHEDLRNIDFMCKDKSVKVWNIGISMEELKAINKKCEELGWL